MKQPRTLHLFKDQENSKRDKPYFDINRHFPEIKEENIISSFKTKYKTKNKTRPKYLFSENNNTNKNMYLFTRPKSSKKPLYQKPKVRPLLTKQQINKNYLNCLSLEKINFQFEEYGEYPDDSFQPSIFFFKFLANKPDYEKENSEKGKPPKARLKLYIPDTIILNDLDTNYWIYTDIEGYVTRIEEVDSDVIEKFRSLEKDENELIGVSKIPIMKDKRLDENQLTLLNLDELEKCLFSKSGSQMAIQRFIKCRGPKAFVCRSVWRRDKPPYIYILTNKANYHDDVKNQYTKYVINSKDVDSYFAFYSTSGKHLEETMFYMNNIVKFIENHSDIIFDELAGDFVKDEAGIWWFINLKAMKIKNFKKFRDEHDNPIPPSLDFFINQRVFGGNELKVNIRKFDYQNKIKCKLCGIDYSKRNLKYSLTTKMILETDNMLKHVQFEKIKFNIVDRPDLKHTDYSMIYLPYRACEDCYLLFETLNDIKTYQIDIANLFRNPVNKVNFGFGFYTKEIVFEDKVELTKAQLNKIKMLNKEIDNLNKDEDDENDMVGIKNNKTSSSNNLTQDNNDVDEENEDDTENNNNGNNNINKNELKLTLDSNKSDNNKNPKEINKQDNVDIITKRSKINNLYRILIIFNDIIWTEQDIKLPNKDLFLVYTFLGNYYKIPLTIDQFTKDLDYTLINFYKIYHIICTEPDGFIKWVEKNRYMEVKIGYFEKSEEDKKKTEVKNLLKKNIVIQDNDICEDINNFVPFATVDLSTQGLKYGTNYRNNLNGLLFKRDEPHYVGKLRCVIRISKVKKIKDITKYKLKNYFNLLIPPVNFVVSDELPDYWIEMVERQKLRGVVLNEIYKTMKKYNIEFNKEKDKKAVLQGLESLVSHYFKISG